MNQFEHIRREIFNLTQAEFARICGVTQATVSRWENGSLAPGHVEMTAIRAEAATRGIPWDDAVFFGTAVEDMSEQRPLGGEA